MQNQSDILNLQENLTIDIIIPCFNVEKTISKTIDSVQLAIQQLKQHIQESNSVFANIICINDCSTDNTQNILNQLKLTQLVINM